MNTKKDHNSVLKYQINNCKWYVGISGFNITDKNLREVYKLFRGRKDIHDINLYSNYITDHSMKYLIKLFKYVYNLQIIDISDNMITDKGMKELALFLKYNRSIVSIHLGSNNIGNSSTKYLFNILKYKNNLQCLYLGDTEINSSKYIIKILKSSNIYALQIGCNSMSIDESYKITNYLEFNPNITCIQYDYQNTVHTNNICTRNKHNITQKWITLFSLLTN